MPPCRMSSSRLRLDLRPAGIETTSTTGSRFLLDCNSALTPAYCAEHIELLPMGKLFAGGSRHFKESSHHSDLKIPAQHTGTPK